MNFPSPLATFLKNYDVTNRKLESIAIYSIVGKQSKREENNIVETTFLLLVPIFSSLKSFLLPWVQGVNKNMCHQKSFLILKISVSKCSSIFMHVFYCTKFATQILTSFKYFGGDPCTEQTVPVHVQTLVFTYNFLFCSEGV